MNKDTKEWKEFDKRFLANEKPRVDRVFNSTARKLKSFIRTHFIPKSELRGWVEKNKIPPQHRDWGIDVPREEIHNRALADLQDKFLEE